LDILWVSICSFLVLGALGVTVEHLRVGKWIKDKLLLVIGALMLISIISGLIAMFFS